MRIQDDLKSLSVNPAVQCYNWKGSSVGNKGRRRESRVDIHIPFRFQGLAFNNADQRLDRLSYPLLNTVIKFVNPQMSMSFHNRPKLRMPCLP